MSDTPNVSLKRIAKSMMREPFKDGNGEIVRVQLPNGTYHIVTRGEAVIDKAIARAERGDMYAFKQLLDLLEPRELRVAVAHAITVEHTLNPALQAVVDKLLTMETETPELPEDSGKIENADPPAKNRALPHQNTSP